MKCPYCGERVFKVMLRHEEVVRCMKDLSTGNGCGKLFVKESWDWSKGELIRRCKFTKTSV